MLSGRLNSHAWAAGPHAPRALPHIPHQPSAPTRARGRRRHAACTRAGLEGLKSMLGLGEGASTQQQQQEEEEDDGLEEAGTMRMLDTDSEGEPFGPQVGGLRLLGGWSSALARLRDTVHNTTAQWAICHAMP